jgi:hypothetical protein
MTTTMRILFAGNVNLNNDFSARSNWISAVVQTIGQLHMVRLWFSFVCLFVFFFFFFFFFELLHLTRRIHARIIKPKAMFDQFEVSLVFFKYRRQWLIISKRRSYRSNSSKCQKPTATLCKMKLINRVCDEVAIRMTNNQQHAHQHSRVEKLKPQNNSEGTLRLHVVIDYRCVPVHRSITSLVALRLFVVRLL